MPKAPSATSHSRPMAFSKRPCRSASKRKQRQLWYLAEVRVGWRASVPTAISKICRCKAGSWSLFAPNSKRPIYVPCRRGTCAVQHRCRSSTSPASVVLLSSVISPVRLLSISIRRVIAQSDRLNHPVLMLGPSMSNSMAHSLAISCRHAR